MAIKAIFFDLDDTLRDRRGVLELYLRPTLELAIGRYPQLPYQRLAQDYHSLAANPPGRLWDEVLRRNGILDPALAQEMAETYNRILTSLLRAFPEVISVLEALRGRYILGVITNGPEEMQKGKLKALDLERYFRAIITSEMAGHFKPEPEIFHKALEAVGCRPEEAMFVGDSLEADVAGAKRVGMVAVWLNRWGEEQSPDGPQPDYEIQSLMELADMLSERVKVKLKFFAHLADRYGAREEVVELSRDFRAALKELEGLIAPRLGGTLGSQYTLLVNGRNYLHLADGHRLEEGDSLAFVSIAGGG